MESQPQNPEFSNNPENFHPWRHYYLDNTSKRRSANARILFKALLKDRVLSIPYQLNND